MTADVTRRLTALLDAVPHTLAVERLVVHPNDYIVVSALARAGSEGFTRAEFGVATFRDVAVRPDPIARPDRPIALVTFRRPKETP